VAPPARASDGRRYRCLGGIEALAPGVKLLGVLSAKVARRDLFEPVAEVALITVEPDDRAVVEYATWADVPPGNRNNILTVLYQHGLIDVVDGQIQPTDKGPANAAASQRQEWVRAQMAAMAAPVAPVTEHRNWFASVAPPAPAIDINQTFADQLRRMNEAQRAAESASGVPPKTNG